MNLRGKITVKYRDTSYAWVDATDGILQIDITRGIPQYFGMWSQCEPGQLRLISRNTNLDPAKNTEIGLFSIIRVEADGVPIFTGKIFDTNTEYVPKEDSTITINAFDELGVLSQTKWGNRSMIGHDYDGKKSIEPINFGTFLKQGSYYPDYDANPDLQSGFENGRYSPYDVGNTGYNYVDTDLTVVGGAKKITWYSDDQTKYPTPGGVSSYTASASDPGVGQESDINWTLPDWDATLISNPGSKKSFGTQNDATTNSTGLYWMYKDGISYSFSSASNRGSRPGVTDTNHALYGDHGFRYLNFGSAGTTNVIDADWAALYSTNDDNALTLWKKCEQSEAGFGFVDAYNRFRHYNRTVAELDIHESKATFASDGTGLSYNNIKVTNGWESVVKGVTINNIWSDNVTSIYNLRGWKDTDLNGGTTGYYVNPPLSNRDGTTVSKLFAKIYSWLGSSAVTEQRNYYEKYASTTPTYGSYSPIYDVNCRDWDIDTLTTRSLFYGTDTTNGNNQLSIDTNYAWNLNGETGGYVYSRLGVRTDFTAERPDNVADRAAELAKQILDNYSTPQTDIRSINFDVHVDDFDTIKNIDIYNRINIDHNESGLTINKQYAVMGITHSITPDNWNVTYQLWNQQGNA